MGENLSGLKMLHPSLLDSLHLLKLTMLGVRIYLAIANGGGGGEGRGPKGGYCVSKVSSTLV